MSNDENSFLNSNKLSNYKNHDNNRNNEDFDDTYGEKSQEYFNLKPIRYLQKKIEPYVNRIRTTKFRFEENARARRLSIFSLLITIIIGSLISAQIFTKSYTINSTPIDKPIQFLNGDTARVNNLTYDKGNNSAMINFSTDSKIGLINSKDLTAKFILLNKTSGKTPTINLISTYSNNFTILINNLTPNFKALKIILNNARTSTIDDYAKAIANNSNKDAKVPMSNTGLKTILDYNNSDNKATDGTGLQGDIKINNGMSFEKANKLLPILKKNNNTNITLKEDTLNENKGTIKDSNSPKQIMINGLNKAINNLNEDIKIKNKLINDNEKSITETQKQINTLQNDQLNLNSKDQVKNLKENISDTKSDINDKEGKISKDKMWAKKYQNQLTLIDKGQITFNKSQEPQKANFFN
ncbi:hypothetical protein DY052_05875 [Apilactobacillus timberlakei]|uniref:hypothetical protein n=1 Tax=Apilactobacillus timberlakei TaxID=2008380 RepID=UPI00112BE727|nr:hypothetical protein [Apilactobacillus timberlakei]TPR14951.1 hypothetical protein DY052_05875 [Apilactobacillus timberlakei]